MMTAEQIYLQYHDKVRAYVRGKIQDPHDVEDLVSAVFMKIVQKLDSYDPAKASVSTWVYTITRSAVTDCFRARRTTAHPENRGGDDGHVLHQCQGDSQKGAGEPAGVLRGQVRREKQPC